MPLKILSLNCQRSYQPGLENFLKRTLESKTYDFLLLQEVNEKVLTYLQNPSYTLVRAFNPDIGAESELCIAYRQNYRLLGQEFISFALMHKDPLCGWKHPSFAALQADVSVNGARIRVGSVHLHSGFNGRVRRAELIKIKRLMLEGFPVPTYFSGDFNAGYPGEATRMARFLSPEFAWGTKNIGPTLDSRYSENAPHLPNRISRVFAWINVSIPLWTDHFFVDRATAEKYTVECRVLPDRVSDHSPVEMIIEDSRF